MTPFGWLCLSHLIADWMLQSDWMARGKRTRLTSVAGLVHYTIYTILIVFTLLFIAPTLDATRYLLLGSLVFTSHWLIDGTDLVQWWMRWVGQRDQSMVRLVIDQTLHLLVLSVVATICCGALHLR
ncbi:MAG: DUF3307 domain-containing protein [Caldilinea sp. CFX5]|nr:DUF3307 domain-containing protein [Caldilinea sp. CFX5]